MKQLMVTDKSVAFGRPYGPCYFISPRMGRWDLYLRDHAELTLLEAAFVSRREAERHADSLPRLGRSPA